MWMDNTSLVMPSPASSLALADSTIEEDEVTGRDEYLFILPTIIILGLGGNIVSLVTIFHSRLRSLPANVYLITLTTADSVFLVGVAMICFKIDFLSYESCAVVEYILMTSAYISSWATACLTIERFMAVSKPLQHVRYGFTERLRIMAYWLPLPFLIHLVQFVILIPTNSPGARACDVIQGPMAIYYDIADVILCFGLPCVIVIVFNALVAVRLRSRSTHFGNEDNAQSRRQGGSMSSQTRILWVVPMVFLLLNTPFYVIRVFAISGHAINEESPIYLQMLYNAVHYLYYMNFASDVLVYAFSSANFRRTAVVAWRRILCECCGRRPEDKFHEATALREDRRGSYLLAQSEDRRRTSTSALSTPLHRLTPQQSVKPRHCESYRSLSSSSKEVKEANGDAAATQPLAQPPPLQDLQEITEIHSAV